MAIAIPSIIFGVITSAQSRTIAQLELRLDKVIEPRLTRARMDVTDLKRSQQLVRPDGTRIIAPIRLTDCGDIYAFTSPTDIEFRATLLDACLGIQ